MQEPIEPPEKVSTEVYRPLMDQVRVIRDRRGLTIAEVFEKYAGPAIAREYRKCVTEMATEIGESGC